jgi:outer membrane biosynthesis protein TonB
VEKAEIVSGNPLLSGAATTALKKWKFTPFTADGKPYRAQATIAFEFKM